MKQRLGCRLPHARTHHVEYEAEPHLSNPDNRKAPARAAKVEISSSS